MVRVDARLLIDLFVSSDVLKKKDAEIRKLVKNDMDNHKQTPPSEAQAQQRKGCDLPGNRPTDKDSNPWPFANTTLSTSFLSIFLLYLTKNVK
ncbi:hypothetical protein Vi05172_g267 [Venturia inaequalis]|nr:hypothetical protein Vi05172_g267 [Venturia inaequalis]